LTPLWPYTLKGKVAYFRGQKRFFRVFSRNHTK
jgi:hypothetical protein